MEILVAIIIASLSLLSSTIGAVITLRGKKAEVSVAVLDTLTAGQREFANQIMKDNDDLRRRVTASEKRIQLLERIIRQNGIELPIGD